MKSTYYTARLFTVALSASLLLSSCGAFRSDTKSNNPAIAAQAQNVELLDQQIEAQKRVVDTEKSKLKTMEYQRKAAKQGLKTAKTRSNI